MADEPILDIPAAPAVSASPIVSEPVAAPASAAPVAASEPAAAPADPVAPVAPAEPHPAEVPSLLDVKPPEPSVAEAKVEPAEKVAESAPTPPAAPEKTEWKFQFPETLRADEPQVARFTGILDELLQPKEGENRAQVAQRLVDLHNEHLVNYAEQVRRDQISAFNNTRRDWQKQVMSDSQIGGSGHQTAMGAIARVRDRLLSDSQPGTAAYETDTRELNDFLRVTGAGDHPVFLRMLHRAARFVDEPSVPAPNARPTPNNGVKPTRSLYKTSSSLSGGSR